MGDDVRLSRCVFAHFQNSFILSAIVLIVSSELNFEEESRRIMLFKAFRYITYETFSNSYISEISI